MQKRIECDISGRVQMVMFRDFVTRTARKLELAGEVWNERDGTVRVIAEGEEVLLHKLIIAIKKGSLLSKVDEVSVQWENYTGKFIKFKIIYK